MTWCHLSTASARSPGSPTGEAASNEALASSDETRVLESAAHRAALASGAPKIASARASGARKKNSERERERRSEKSGSASGERRS